MCKRYNHKDSKSWLYNDFNYFDDDDDDDNDDDDDEEEEQQLLGNINAVPKSCDGYPEVKSRRRISFLPSVLTLF